MKKNEQPVEMPHIPHMCVQSIIRRHAAGWIMHKEKAIAEYLFAKAEEMATDILAALEQMSPKRESGGEG